MGEDLSLLLCFQLFPFVSHSLSLPHSLLFSLSFASSLSLIPNQWDSPSALGLNTNEHSCPMRITTTQACAQYTNSHTRARTHTHTCRENCACNHRSLCVWTYVIHMQHLLTHVFFEHMPYYEYISHMHTHTHMQKKPHTQTALITRNMQSQAYAETQPLLLVCHSNMCVYGLYIHVRGACAAAICCQSSASDTVGPAPLQKNRWDEWWKLIRHKSVL